MKRNYLLFSYFSVVFTVGGSADTLNRRFLQMTSSRNVLAIVSEEISRATGTNFFGTSNSVGGGTGGSGASTFVIKDDESGWDYFVKMSNSAGYDMLRTEYEGVKAMHETHTIKVPRPICYGATDYKSFVVFEKLSMGGYADPVEGGTKLAMMHSCSSPNGKFGWDYTNTCGATMQPNAWCDSWVEFWDTQRLGHMLKLAKADGASFPEEEELRAKVKMILSAHDCTASPVHGDLWAGNFGATKEGEPVIFDPAFYYGDREVDIAMTKLFGSQSKQFYDAYDKVHPPKEGWQQRETVYNLYHILNHFVLFGGGYLGSAKQMIGKILNFDV